VEPALALAVPSDLQRLQAPAGQGDQVLLQRRDAEGVAHLEVGQLAVGSVGADHELVAALEEAGGDALVLERGVVEVAAHRLLGRCGHGLRVVRLLPLPALLLMATEALLVVDVGSRQRGCAGRGLSGGGWRGGRMRQGLPPPPGTGNAEREKQQDQRHQKAPAPPGRG
jgi:hypothetical protein